MANLRIWLDHTMTPAGVSNTVSVITNADVTVGGQPAIKDIRGRAITKLRPDRLPSIQTGVQLSCLEAQAVSADVVALQVNSAMA